MTDPAVLELGYIEARERVAGRQAWLESMRNRATSVIGVASGVGSLAAGRFALLADR